METKSNTLFGFAGRILVSCFLIGFFASQARADFVYDRVLPKDPSRTHSDDRRYALYVPSGYTGDSLTPLVLALHGCVQTNLTIAKYSRLEEMAEQEGFIVAYPYIGKNDTQTNDENRAARCWGFWMVDEIHRDNGEVGDLARLVDQLKGDYNIDANRVHIMGISSGGAMTTAALVAYPDVFASGAVHDGVGYAETAGVFTGSIPDCDLVLNNNLGVVRPPDQVIPEMRAEMQKSNLRQVPIMAIHNTKDCNVPLKVGQGNVESFAGLMAEEDNAVDITNPVSSTSGTTNQIPWTHNKYGAGSNGESLIETVYFDAHFTTLENIETRLLTNEDVPGSGAPKDIDRGHAWFGGKRGPYVLTSGPFVAEVAWKFFENHTLKPTDKPVVSCDEPAVSDKSVELTCEAEGPSPIASYHLVVSGPLAKDETLPGPDGFTKKYEDLADGDYQATVTATDEEDIVSAKVTKPFSIGTPAICITANNPTHIDEGRAYACGDFLFFDWRACAKGSDDDLGFRFFFFSSSLEQTGPDHWIKVENCQ